jgi:hypothetical protein
MVWSMRALAIAVVLLLACAGAPAGSRPPAPDADDDAAAGSPPADAARTPTPDAAAAAEGPSFAPDVTVEPPPPDAALPATGDGGIAQMLLSRAIGLGYYHSCLVTPTHEIRCFGNVAVDDPRVHPPAGLRAEQISGAHNGFCVLPVGAMPALPGGVLPLSIVAKKLTCWGHKNTFFPPANLEMNPIQYGIGYDHGCALNADHSVVCWGQPGTMFKAPDGLRAKALAVASFFNCVIKEDDSVACWGINPPAPPPDLRAKIIAVTFHGNAKLPDAPQGTNHACAIQLDDTVKCWGTDDGGNLTPPVDLGPVRDIAVATIDSCALKMDGTPVCWGTNKYDAMDPTRYHPMPPGLHLKAIRAKLATYCGIRMEDDTIACWGDEQHDHITFPAGGVKLYVPAD